MIKELTEIRQKLSDGLERKDMLYISMQINNIDTLLYHLTEQAKMPINDKVDDLQSNNIDAINLKDDIHNCEKEIESLMQMKSTLEDKIYTNQQMIIMYKNLMKRINK